MQQILFEKVYEIRSYDTNCNGKLSLNSLFSYLQDIAGLHATILHFGKDDLDKDNNFWALSRIICKMKKVPEWNEKILIKTWPKGVSGIFAIRNFQICREDGQLIGEASSSWIVVDAETRKPVRPGELLSGYDKESPVKKFDCPQAGKLPVQTDTAYKSKSEKVQYSDLDINMHVNNANYLKWVVNSYPLDFVLTHYPVEVEINYLSEVIPGDEYIVSAEEISNSFYHSIVKENGKKVACRVRIDWQSCDDTKLY